MRARLPSLLLLGTALAALGGCKGGPAGRADAGALDAAPPASATQSAALADASTPPDDLIPATSSDELTSRARHLLEAVSADDPDLATDILFPRDGWIGLRDVDDPGKEWDRKVDRPFRRGIHAASRHHLQGAQFVSLDLGHAVVQEPARRHGWKKPLWTVHGSRMTYLIDGHTRTLSIREMTAWRGAWYVTRLR